MPYEKLPHEKTPDEKASTGSEPGADRSARPAAFDPASYRVDETLLDSIPILIRAIRPDDKDRLREHGRGLSRESVYHRFMAYRRDLSEDDLRRFTELDFDNHVGIMAILNEDGRERAIGVGRYIRTTNGRAEVAFSVVDQYQGHGVGTLLLAHLSRIARQWGITEFEADVMSDNVHMLDVIAASGFRLHKTSELGVVHVLMGINSPDRE
jgi:GNAT superfamily N-acetyltransferase